MKVELFNPEREPLPRTWKIAGLHKPRVRDQNFQWTGQRGNAIFDLIGCQWPRFENLEIWAEPDARLKYGFHARSGAGKVATGAHFTNVRVFGTDGGIHTAWKMDGLTNGDFNVWRDCMASNVRRGWSLNGQNQHGNSFFDCGVGYAEVGIGDDGASGSFHATNFNATSVKTVFKLSSATRSSSVIGGDMENCDMLFDVGRVGNIFHLAFAHITLTQPKRMWERDPTRPLVGRFACSGGLVLENIAIDTGHPEGNKLPDGRWRSVIEVWDLKGVRAHNVCAELVQIDHGTYSK